MINEDRKEIITTNEKVRITNPPAIQRQSGSGTGENSNLKDSPSRTKIRKEPRIIEKNHDHRGMRRDEN